MGASTLDDLIRKKAKKELEFKVNAIFNQLVKALRDLQDECDGMVSAVEIPTGLVNRQEFESTKLHGPQTMKLYVVTKHLASRVIDGMEVSHGNAEVKKFMDKVDEMKDLVDDLSRES